MKTETFTNKSEANARYKELNEELDFEGSIHRKWKVRILHELDGTFSVQYIQNEGGARWRFRN